MAIPPNWQEVSNLDDAALTAAFQLLKDTYNPGQYGHLQEVDLQRKMRPGERPPTPLFCLRVFSYKGPANPSISAFFFLRRRHGVWAYCLTVGALPASTGLPVATLHKQLRLICEHMRTLIGGARLDVMHQGATPNFKDPSGNLATVYSDAITAKLLRPDNALTTAFPWPKDTLTLFWVDLP